MSVSRNSIISRKKLCTISKNERQDRIIPMKRKMKSKSTHRSSYTGEVHESGTIIKGRETVKITEGYDTLIDADKSQTLSFCRDHTAKVNNLRNVPSGHYNNQERAKRRKIIE